MAQSGSHIAIFFRKLSDFWFNEYRFWRKVIIRIVLLIVLGGVATLVVVGNYLYNFIITQPEYSIYDLPLALPSRILDKNGKELYSFFDEKRTVVNFDNISPLMVNALVSAEDQNFWSNDGFDPKAIIRSSYITLRDRRDNGFLGYSQGASTLTQQIVKNTIGSKEKKIERKIHEIIQAWLLTYNTYAVNKQYFNGDSSKIREKTKEDILTYYMNSMFFGNNAYGVAEASKLYFGSSPRELNVQQSAILAGIPQSPYYFDPYRFPENIAGAWMLSIENEAPLSIDPDKYGYLFANLLTGSYPGGENLGDALPQFSGIMGSGSETKHWSIYYQAGRKDYVLQRLRDEHLITSQQAWDALITPVKFQDPEIRFPIQAPHFVNYIKDQILTNPDIPISEQQLYQGGYTIHTTLNLDDQTEFEKIVLAYSGQAYALGAGNRALLVTNTQDGSIIAYVGSKDFYNTVIDGQVDMIRNARQVGSALKPLVYAYALSQYPLGMDSIIHDVRTDFGAYIPRNADGRYIGGVTLKTALTHSRNVPAVKVFNAMGGVDAYLPWLQSLGMKNLDPDGQYGLSMALGTAPMSMIDIAQGYLQLADTEQVGLVHGISSIQDRNGMTIYEHDSQKMQRQIPLGVARLVTYMLQTSSFFPNYMKATIDPDGCASCASKTGTSNVVRNGKSYVRDGRLVTYNPDIMMVMRAGNTDGKELPGSSYGYLLNTSFRDAVLNFLIERGYTTPDVYRQFPDDLTSVYPGQGEGYKYPVRDSIPQSVKKNL